MKFIPVLLFVFFTQSALAEWERVTVLDSNVRHGSKQRVHLIGFDQFGEIQFTSRYTPVRKRMNFTRVPVEVVTVQLEYVERSGDTIATFSTSVNLSAPVMIVDPPMVDANDPIISSFAFMGCNRVADGAGSENLPSTANVANLIQDFTEIPDPFLHSPTPAHLVFVGDLVVNHVPGIETLTTQLTAWKNVYETTALSYSDTELVTIAGNHELLQKVEQNGNTVEIQNPPTGEVFTSLMSKFIPAKNGPTQSAPNFDNVARNESMLSFSFQSDNLFFIQLNTDTYTGDDSPDGVGFVPLFWLQDQLLQAQESLKIEHIFVLGHKPVIGETGTGETISLTQVDEFTAMLCNPAGDDSPSKVRGYFAAHAHYWQHTLLDCPSSEMKLEQIINGNAGTSPEQEFFEPPHGFFGYSIIGITESGSVVLEAWGRFITSPDDEPNQAETTLREHRMLNAQGQTWGLHRKENKLTKENFRSGSIVHTRHHDTRKHQFSQNQKYK